MEVLSYMIPFS